MNNFGSLKQASVLERTLDQQKVSGKDFAASSPVQQSGYLKQRNDSYQTASVLFGSSSVANRSMINIPSMPQKSNALQMVDMESKEY